ncbi:MAG: hypothetical protein LCI00_33750 [Chloroflexi bacterium]|nr:hypothetical protein [Chloroflexota bacterium]MCC6894311.1 hypothetical protein [Anaerolineae bacterium]
MFEFNEHYSELEALDALFASFDLNDLPSWNVSGQNGWTMDFDYSALVTAEWVMQTADVA